MTEVTYHLGSQKLQLSPTWLQRGFKHCSHSTEWYLNHQLEHKAETETFLSILRECGGGEEWSMDIELPGKIITVSPLLFYFTSIAKSWHWLSPLMNAVKRSSFIPALGKWDSSEESSPGKTAPASPVAYHTRQLAQVKAPRGFSRALS